MNVYDENTAGDAAQAKSAPADRATAGPLDESEASAVRPYIDFGGIKLLPRDGMQVRLEVEEGSKRVVAIGLDLGGSTLQLQPFAAPRSGGLWHEIRGQIAEQIAKQGGTTSLQVGTFGPELVAQIPVSTPGQPSTTRIARFIGVDGPRWFLRGVVAGEAATSRDAAAIIDEVFRGVVVVRGNTPMPPRDLIPLQVPAGAETPGSRDAGGAARA